MLEFPTVSKEIRGLLARRQELNTLVGSVFAAMGLFLQNALQGGLPPSLALIEEHLFAFYAVMLMVPCMVLALRTARLHGGMVLNGMLYARLMAGQDFTRKGDVDRASRHNYFGVSFLQFVQTDVLGAFSAGALALSLGAGPAAAGLVTAVVFAGWLALHFRFHRRAVAFARRKIAAEGIEPFTRDDWEAHVSESLQNANHHLTALIGFVGLMIFSVFEVISGLGRVDTNRPPDLDPALIRDYGAGAYSAIMMITCLLGVVMYLRVRVAVGQFSLDLDPTDQPFRLGKLTDSLLGYLLLGFFLAVAVHLAAVQVAPGLGEGAALVVDALVLALAVLAERLTLVWAARRYAPPKPEPEPAPEPLSDPQSVTPATP